LSEAALAAVPTVAYDIDWQGELIETGKTGILVGYRNVSALTAAAKQLLDDPATAAKFGRSLRSRALEMLDPSRLDDHERAEYRKLLARSSGSSRPRAFTAKRGVATNPARKIL
jgi:glycosyltransferase involved in cell wall biosynthesis